MTRKFIVRQVLFEVEQLPGKTNGRDLSRLVLLAVGDQLAEGQIVQNFRLQDWHSARVGERGLPMKEYRDGMLIGQEIEGEHRF